MFQINVLIFMVRYGHFNDQNRYASAGCGRLHPVRAQLPFHGTEKRMAWKRLAVFL